MRLHLLFALLLTALLAALQAPAGMAEDKPADTSKTAEPKPAAESEKLVEETFDKLVLKVPAAWKKEQPSSRLRLGQFAIPAGEGDKDKAELGIFNFGAGGGVDANVRRWIGQFQSEGRMQKLTEGAWGEDGKYVFVELSGIYNAPVGPPVAQQTKATPGSRMLGVILVSEARGVFFLKLTGPDKTVAAQAEALRASFGAVAKQEKEFKLGE